MSLSSCSDMGVRGSRCQTSESSDGRSLYHDMFPPFVSCVFTSGRLRNSASADASALIQWVISLGMTRGHLTLRQWRFSAQQQLLNRHGTLLSAALLVQHPQHARASQHMPECPALMWRACKQPPNSAGRAAARLRLNRAEAVPTLSMAGNSHAQQDRQPPGSAGPGCQLPPT